MDTDTATRHSVNGLRRRFYDELVMQSLSLEKVHVLLHEQDLDGGWSALPAGQSSTASQDSSAGGTEKTQD